MAENFYFKNLDILGMLDDMESNFAKDLDKLIKKYGGKILRGVKMKTPVGQYNDGRTGGLTYVQKQRGLRRSDRRSGYEPDYEGIPAGAEKALCRQEPQEDICGFQICGRCGCECRGGYHILPPCD